MKNEYSMYRNLKNNYELCECIMYYEVAQECTQPTSLILAVRSIKLDVHNRLPTSEKSRQNHDKDERQYEHNMIITDQAHRPTTQYNASQHNTTQRNTTQRNTTQRNTQPI